MERENIQSTAVGNGIAIPHCFTDEVPDLIIAVARATAGLEFDSFDGQADPGGLPPHGQPPGATACT